MIYTQLTNKAIKLMFEAHKDQLDKSGMPYVFHPWHVAESMTDEKSCIVALLHDIVEDTNITLDNLRENGFPDDVIEAIDILTKKDNQEYAEYIRNIAKNEIATNVKISDLIHNLDKSRSLGKLPVSNIKYQIYQSSLDYLIHIRKLNNEKKQLANMKNRV